MNIKKVKAIAGAVALSTFLNGCALTLELGKKDKTDEPKQMELTSDMTFEEGMDFLLNNNTISFYCADDLTCPVEKIEDGIYKCQKGYFLYSVTNSYGGMLHIIDEDDYTIYESSFNYDENGNIIHRAIDGAIGIKKEYKTILNIIVTLNQMINEKSDKVTTELKLVDAEHKFYLVPNGYELYSFNNDKKAYLVEITKDGAIYQISNAENYIAVKSKAKLILERGNLLLNYIYSSYEEQTNNMKR